jgi:transposase
MSTAKSRVIRVERTDDIPVLLAQALHLHLAEILDRHFPTNHRWKGELTFGEVVSVWLTLLISQGDHRLYQLQPWAEHHLLTLQQILTKSVRPLDFHDDRLADILDRFAQPESWESFEADLNQNTIRVYHLRPSLFRIDTTTASSYAEILSEDGLLQFGHSKDRDDLPQIKIAIAALDPLGLPMTTVAVPGNYADDPLYVPEVKKVQRAFGKGGKTFVGDCKMASLDTRAYLVSTHESYLCPLTEKQVSKQARSVWLQSVWDGRQTLQQVHRPPAKGQTKQLVAVAVATDGQTPELVAEGFALDVQQQANVDGKQVVWMERRWFVRSLAFAQGQKKQLERRLQSAQEQIEQLNQRKQGKKVLTAKEMREATAGIVKKQRVEGLLCCEVRTTTQNRTLQRYRERPERMVREHTHRVEVMRQQDVIELTLREMGWRMYATNHLEMNLVAVVWGYRGQYRIEDDWSRLKGRPLSLTPMYVQEESRIHGLVLLLSLAIRQLTLLEWAVRKKLTESEESLRGVYPGQPGRQADRPGAEMLLKVFKDINLIIVEVSDQQMPHITPLTPLQEQLLGLWELPSDLYRRLTLPISESPKF